MMTCGRGHLCSRGASLAHEVAKATREVRVFCVNGGYFRLWRFHDVNVFILGKGEGASVCCRTRLAGVRCCLCASDDGLRLLEGDEPDAGAEGGIHAIPDLVKAIEVGGWSTQKGPKRSGGAHGCARSPNRRSHGVRRKPQVREPPEGVRGWRQGGKMSRGRKAEVPRQQLWQVA